MKKLIVFTIYIGILTNVLVAQNQSIKKETFDQNTYGWEEKVEKKKSATIKDGYLVLTNKKKEGSIEITTRLPLQVKKRFKVTSKLLIPKLNDENRFGVIFNKIDDENYLAFLVKKENYYLINKENNTTTLEKTGKIKLKEGKNQTVTIIFENKGGKLVFVVNGMTAIEVKQDLRYSDFGFYSEGSGTIKIDEILIEQQIDEE